MGRAGYYFASRGRHFGRTFFRDNRFAICAYIFLVLIGVLTGIFTAFKTGGALPFRILTDFTLAEYSATSLASLGVFFSRFFSVTLILVILSVFSLTIFLVPIGCVIIFYRSYLVGLNISLMAILFGFGGAIQAVLIIFPLQLLMLGIFGVYFMQFAKMCSFKRKYGRGGGLLKLFLVCMILLLLLVIAETVLLIIFSSRVILVI